MGLARGKLGGFVAGCVVATAVHLATHTPSSSRDSRELGERAPQLHPDPVTDGGASDHAMGGSSRSTGNGPLSGNPRSPDSARRSDRSAQAAGTDLDALARLVESRDGAGLAGQLAQILESGKEGYALLAEFVRYATRDRRRVLYDARLGFSLLTLAVRYDAEIASLAEHLLAELSTSQDLEIRRSLVEFLPWFLAHNDDRFPELQQQFQQLLLESLKMPEPVNIQQILDGMEAVRLEPPGELLVEILADRDRVNQHSLLIEYLVQRNDVFGAEILTRFVDLAERFDNWTVRQALESISRMDVPEVHFDAYLSSPVRELRETAVLAYFSSPRDLHSLSWVIEFLNSDSSFDQKRKLLAQLRWSSGEIIRILKDETQLIFDDAVRDLVLKIKAPPSRG